MKKTIIAAVLALGVSAVTVFAQGTVNFQNSFLTPIRVDGVTMPAVGTTSYSFQLLYGTSAGNLAFSTAVFLNSSTAGVLAGNNLLALANAPEGSSVFYELEGWNTTAGSYGAATVRGVSPVLNIANIAAAAGPGTVLFGTGAGQIDTTLVTGNFQLLTVPEPTSMALLGLGAVSLFAFRRRK